MCSVKKIGLSVHFLYSARVSSAEHNWIILFNNNFRSRIGIGQTFENANSQLGSTGLTESIMYQKTTDENNVS